MLIIWNILNFQPIPWIHSAGQIRGIDGSFGILHMLHFSFLKFQNWISCWFRRLKIRSSLTNSNPAFLLQILPSFFKFPPILWNEWKLLNLKDFSFFFLQILITRPTYIKYQFIVNIWRVMQQESRNLWFFIVSRDPCYSLQVMCFLVPFWVIFQMQH